MPDHCKTYLDCESGVCEINNVLHWPKPEDQNNWERMIVISFNKEPHLEFVRMILSPACMNK